MLKKFGESFENSKINLRYFGKNLEEEVGENETLKELLEKNELEKFDSLFHMLIKPNE